MQLTRDLFAIAKFLFTEEKPFPENGQTDRQTDGRTDRITIPISRVSVLTRDKNEYHTVLYVFKINLVVATEQILRKMYN